MGVVIAFRRNYAKKIDPCRMLVWYGRRTVQNMVGSVHAVIWQAGTNGQVLFEFKFTTAQSVNYTSIYPVFLEIKNNFALLSILSNRRSNI